MDTWEALRELGFEPDSSIRSDDKPGLSFRIGQSKLSVSFCMNLRFARIALFTGHLSDSSILSEIRFELMSKVESVEQCAALLAWNLRTNADILSKFSWFKTGQEHSHLLPWRKKIDNDKSASIAHWPEGDRPREKLLAKGPKVLSDSELLAIILRTGTKGSTAIDLARDILTKFKSFRNMGHTDCQDWEEFKGLGSAKTAQIQAALEIGRRYQQDVLSTGKQKIASAKDIVDIVMPHMRDLKTEVFKVIYLDSNNRVIDISDAAVGTIDHAFPIIREIIHIALQRFSKSIVCVHNHPSAESSPSIEDKKFTRDLCEAGKLMEIKILDHIIIAGDKHFSFVEEGLM